MKDALKRIIADFHEIPLPAFRRRTLEVPLDLGKIIIIIGPRRAGKTYYLYQLMADLKQRGASVHQLLYLNFEDERLDLQGDNDLIFDAYRELYPNQDLANVYIFFDEIQELPDWEKFVRRINDSISKKIFLSGSNARLLSKEIATALRGRSLTFEILPLSFSEYLAFNDIPSNDQSSSRHRALVDNAFEQYCQWGGFPETVTIQERFKAQVLQEYFNVMLYRDLVERYEIKDISVLKYLLKRLIGSFTKEFSVNKLYNELKSRSFSIGKDAIYRMMEAIFSIYMVASVERYDPAVIRREMTNKKVFLYDNGFATALHYSFSEDRGKHLENLVFRHLREQTEEIFFARNGWECDFAIFQAGRPATLVQVTQHLDRDNLDREIKGLTSGKQFIGNAEGLLLFNTADRELKIPGWIQLRTVKNWLLGCE